MVYETLKQIMQTPEAVYAGAAAGGMAISGLVGYLVNRRTKRNLKETKNTLENSRYSVRRKEAEVEALNAKNEVQRLTYEKQLKDPEKQKELKEQEHRHKLEIEKIDYERKCERTKNEAQALEDRRMYRLSIAEKLAGMTGLLEGYLEELRKAPDTPNEFYDETLKKRQELREELIGDFVKDYDYFGNDSETDLSDYSEKIEELLDLRFPLQKTPSQEIRMPAELKKLLDILNEEV